jgi:hypothetical protein
MQVLEVAALEHVLSWGVGGVAGLQQRWQGVCVWVKPNGCLHYAWQDLCRGEQTQAAADVTVVAACLLSLQV